MNIQQIYIEQKPWLDRKLSYIYNDFVRDIEKDKRFSLSDDELGELFNELLFKHLSENISDYELMRLYKNSLKKE